MKSQIKPILITILLFITTYSEAQVKMNFEFDTPYGFNEKVGKYVELNGCKLYYEAYGEGEPLLLIHGNSANITGMGNQIDYFKSKYRVIVADNRGHGKSGLNTDSLTYVQMADDWAALADHLNLDSVNIIGWSDGGIVALIMAYNHPEKVKKIVAMGANLRPDSTAIYTYAYNEVTQQKRDINTEIKEKGMTKERNLEKQRVGLLVDQPTISKSDLAKIKVPVMVIAGDKDIIREEHTVEIYQSLPNAQLCIVPGETHFMPASSPEIFNPIVAKFLKEAFKRPDSDFTKW